MSRTIALVASGEMGAALGGRLVAAGLRVLTRLSGRSASSVARARAAGMQDAGDHELAACRLFISVVPPAAALETARWYADIAARHPAGGDAPARVYLDLNAIAPETVARIEAMLAPAGVALCDGCIIGTPPRPGHDGPFVYGAGPHRAAVSLLADAGLETIALDGPNGAASALKMCFAGIMKGLTAVGSASFIAASRVGADEALARQLERSQPELMAWFTRQMPAMYDKSGRWVAEMEQIAAFLERDEGAGLFDGAATLYAGLAEQTAAGTARRALLAPRFPPRRTLPGDIDRA